MRENRNFHAEQGGGDGGSEQLLVPGVVGVSDQCDTRCEQLGPGGLDEDIRVCAVEGQSVVGGGLFLVFEFGLRHRGAESDVPQRGGIGLVGLATRDVAKKCALRHTLSIVTDGAVGL